MPDLKKKLGPLPVWAWGLIIGVGALIYYERSKSSSTATGSAQTTGILDPNAVDPNTGLTYGQEESAALSPGVTGSESGAQGTNPSTNEFGDFLSFLDEWNQFANAMGWAPPGTTATTPSSTGSGTTTTAAAPGGPASPAPSAPKTPVHTQPGPKPQTPVAVWVANETPKQKATIAGRASSTRKNLAPPKKKK